MINEVDSPVQRVTVWDLPTRAFHWLLAVAVIALVITAKTGGAAMVWHGRLGYAVGALILFRLVWGFVGGRWSRFHTFPPSPFAAIAYFRDPATHARPGHSPLGALSVYALLLILVAQVTTGLFSDDAVEFSGPLGVLVSNKLVRLATWYHKNIGQYVILTLVALHIAAILYYQVRKGQDLLRPMIGGKALAVRDTLPSRDDWRSRLAAITILLAASAVVYAIVRLGD